VHILLVSEDVPYANMGGLAKHVLNLARALVQAGHQVDLLGGTQQPYAVTGAEGDFGGRFIAGLNGHLAGWKERKLGVFMPPRRTWIARRFAGTIMRHAHGYDVIHYHGHVPNVAAFIPPQVNFIQTRHDQGSDCVMHTRFRQDAVCRATAAVECAGCVAARPNALQRAISAWTVTHYRREVARGMRRHKTLFVSDMLKSNLQRTLGPGHWGETLHHFADRPHIDAARASVRPTSQQHSLQVMVAGKITPAKGIAAFLHAVAPLLPERMRVTVAGDGPQEQQLRAQFKDRPQIHFRGWCSRDQTLQMTAAAHAVVVPSVWEEPFGSTVLEGLLMGKPTFALARGGTPEMGQYALAPDQLRLFPDIGTLVQDLVAHKEFRDHGAAPAGLGAVEQIIDRLLEIYRLPPGPIPMRRVP
jgi:glycosyltransferase involved in cell wall biosynthesis